MEKLFYIQDNYFISDEGETICTILFSAVYHYESDGEYTNFFDEKNTKRRTKLQLWKVIKEVKTFGLVKYKKCGAVNLNYFSDILPLQAGRNKHDMLLSNGVKLEIPVERLTKFRNDVNQYKFEKYRKLMFRR